MTPPNNVLDQINHNRNPEEYLRAANSTRMTHPGDSRYPETPNLELQQAQTRWDGLLRVILGEVLPTGNGQTHYVEGLDQIIGSVVETYKSESNPIRKQRMKKTFRKINAKLDKIIRKDRREYDEIHIDGAYWTWMAVQGLAGQNPNPVWHDNIALLQNRRTPDTLEHEAFYKTFTKSLQSGTFPAEFANETDFQIRIFLLRWHVLKQHVMAIDLAYYLRPMKDKTIERKGFFDKITDEIYEQKFVEVTESIQWILDDLTSYLKLYDPRLAKNPLEKVYYLVRRIARLRKF